MGHPLAPPDTGSAQPEPAIRSGARLMLPALPFVIIAAIAVPRLVIGLRVGPAALLASVESR